MASQYHQIFPFLILAYIILLFLTNTSANPTKNHSAPPPSIYSILESHGLPVGLFPKDVSDFSIDPSTGRFEFHLSVPSPCDAKFETSVRYNWNVSGVIRYGQIYDLNGVSAQELFLWLPVKGIRVDIPSSGLIYFDVGVVFKQFSLSFFETPRDCTFVAIDDQASVSLDLSFQKYRNRIIQNQPRKFVKEHYPGHASRAVS